MFNVGNHLAVIITQALLHGFDNTLICLVQHQIVDIFGGNVIFCWVMHKRAVVEDLLARLDLSGARFFLFTLDVSEAELTRRLSRDVERGLRDSGIVERSLARRREFDAFGEVVPTDGISPAEAARAIASAVLSGGARFYERGAYVWSGR